MRFLTHRLCICGAIKTLQQHWHYQWRDFMAGLTFCLTNGRALKDSVRWLCQCMYTGASNMNVTHSCLQFSDDWVFWMLASIMCHSAIIHVIYIHRLRCNLVSNLLIFPLFNEVATSVRRNGCHQFRTIFIIIYYSDPLISTNSVLFTD